MRQSWLKTSCSTTAAVHQRTHFWATLQKMFLTLAPGILKHTKVHFRCPRTRLNPIFACALNPRETSLGRLSENGRDLNTQQQSGSLSDSSKERPARLARTMRPPRPGQQWCHRSLEWLPIHSTTTDDQEAPTTYRMDLQAGTSHSYRRRQQSVPLSYPGIFQAVGHRGRNYALQVLHRRQDHRTGWQGKNGT